MICQLEINPEITLEALRMAKLYGGMLLVFCCLLWLLVAVIVVLCLQWYLK